MTKEESKLEILKKVESGVLSIEEGSQLLGIFDNAEKHTANPEIFEKDDAEFTEPHEVPKVHGCWKAAWSMILLGGAILTAFSAFWVYQGYQNNGFGWAFWLSWIPLVVGLFIMIGGWVLIESPWLHVGVHSKEENRDVNIVFNIPVPLGLARWVFRTFGEHMPQEVQSMDILNVLDEAEASLEKGTPFHIQIDDETDGSKVEIFMGK